jgi:hypothetical protein
MNRANVTKADIIVTNFNDLMDKYVEANHEIPDIIHVNKPKAMKTTTIDIIILDFLILLNVLQLNNYYKI